MITLLPRWVWIGAWVLAMNAGMVNAVGLFSVFKQSTSHLTGTATLVIGNLASGHLGESLHHLTLLVAFFIGTVISGLLIQDSTLRLGRRYSVALILVAFLLVLAIPLLEAHDGAGLYAMACACGLQNAMVSTYSGAVVRTTHVTGMFTDLGIYLGHAARGLPIDRRRLRLCLIVISGFCVGVGLGTLGFLWMGFATLALPAMICAVVAVVYWIYRSVMYRRRIAESSENPAPTRQ